MHFNKATLENIAKSGASFDKKVLGELTSIESFFRNGPSAIKEDPWSPNIRANLGHVLHNYHADQNGDSHFNPDKYLRDNPSTVRLAFEDNARECSEHYKKAFNHYFLEHLQTIAEGVDVHHLVDAATTIDSNISKGRAILSNDLYDQMRHRLYGLYGKDAELMTNEEIKSLFKYSVETDIKIFERKFRETKEGKHQVSKSKVVQYLVDNYDHMHDVGVKEALVEVYLKEHSKKD